MSIQVTPVPVTIDHEELQGSPQEVGDETNFKARRMLKCRWADRLALYDQMLTGYIINAGGTPPLITRIGQQYPDYPGVYAVRCTIEPFASDVRASDAQGRIAKYLDAKLNVDYEPRNFNYGSGPNASQIGEESIETVAEFLTQPYESLYWDTSGLPPALLHENEAPGKIIRSLIWVYTYRQVVSLPAGWRWATGYINSTAITSTSTGFLFDAETLLYEGVRLQRTVTSGAQQAWTAQLRFTYRPETWNKWYKRGGDTPQIVYKKNGSRYEPYPKTNFVTALNLV